jgi:hypothetical protein
MVRHRVLSGKNRALDEVGRGDFYDHEQTHFLYV